MSCTRVAVLLHGLPATLGVAALAALAGLGGACTSGAKTSCSFHAECPVGQACVGERCVEGCRSKADCPAGKSCSPTARCVDEADAGSAGGPGTDGGGGVPGLCLPVPDGRVTRAELPLGPGLGAPFLALAPVQEAGGAAQPPPAGGGAAGLLFPDLEGRAAPDGSGRRWDLSAAAHLPGTQAERRWVALLDPAELPVGERFPGADHAVLLPDTPGVLAFFALDDLELRLLGLADPRGELTLLHYDPPVTVLRFPVEPGRGWETTATARGSFLGAAVRVGDRYRTEVRAAGRALLPAGELPVVQLVTVLERSFDSAGFSQTYSTVDFLGECGGVVAKAFGAEGAGAGAGAGAAGLPAGVRLLQLLLPGSCRSADECGQGGACGADGYCRADGAASGLPDGGGPACRGDGDGVVSDAEFVAQPGLSGVFRVRTDGGAGVPVALHGTALADGRRLWDFGEPQLAPGEEERVEATRDPAGLWCAASFPRATYAAVLDAATGTLAFFRREPGALLMLGLASEQPGETLLVYEEPVAALRFPMALGDRWSASTRAGGVLAGVPGTLRLDYTFTVDAAGKIRLPAGEIPVLRQRIDSVQQVEGAAYAVSRKTQLFFAECLGAVARVLSPINEGADEFPRATELARMTVPRCLGPVQCPAGQSCDRGLCVGEGGGAQPGEDGGVATGEGGLADEDAGGSGGEEDGGSGPAPDGGVPLCNPLGDGVVQRDEVLLAPGITTAFLFTEDEEGVPVQLAGRPCAAGRCWEFPARPGDVERRVELLPVEGSWFAEDFPQASHATLLDREREWLGVFRLGEAALELLGAASVEPGALRTLYEPPVPLYRFPLGEGDAWSAETTQRGYWGFSPVLSEDRYTVRVAAGGEVATPAGRFRALQVITRISQHVPFTFISSEQVIHTFISECNGIVARVVSLDDEGEELYVRARSVERLSMGDAR